MDLLKRLFHRRPHREAAHRLYMKAAAQSRLPALYEDFRIPDTIDGRFDALVLHVFLILHRLRQQGEAALDLSHEIVDVLIGDMDRTLREMGIADVGVGKRVKNMLKAFYGRLGAYDEALNTGDGAALREGIVRNVYRGTSPGDAIIDSFETYMRAEASALAAQPLERFMDGTAQFQPMGNIDAAPSKA